MPLLVQRGSFDFGATEDTDTVTLGTAVASLGQAFARITGVRFSSGGPSAGTTGDRNADDLGVSCVLTATNTITFTRESGGADEDVRVYWEVIEFESSGPNAAVVRYHDNITMASATGQQDQSVSGVSTLGDCVPFICGIRTSQSNVYWDDAGVTAKMVDVSGDKVRLDRESTGATTVVSVAVVEFTGSNWTVQNNIEHNYTAAGSNETESITSVVDISHAFVVCGHRFNTSANDNLGYNCWFKDVDELYFRLNSGSDVPADDYTVAHVIRNDDMIVEHMDSITGSGTDAPAGSSSPQSIQMSVTAVGSMSRSCLFATADDNNSSTAYPQPFWLYRLTDVDEVTFWRGRYGSVAEWTLQVVQIPVIGDIEGSSAGEATTAGTLGADGELEGSSAGVATTTGDLDAKAKATGTTAGQATVTGTADAFAYMVGVAAGVATVTGIPTSLGTAAPPMGTVSESTGIPNIQKQLDPPRKGLRIPLGVTKQGRSATVSGDTQDQKIINTALSGNDNLNAFQQDPGLGEDMVFDLSDPVVRGKIMGRLRDVFNDFEAQNRYRLLEDTIEWEEDPANQELNVRFKYHNLETDDVKDFEKGYREGV